MTTKAADEYELIARRRREIKQAEDQAAGFVYDEPEARAEPAEPLVKKPMSIGARRRSAYEQAVKDAMHANSFSCSYCGGKGKVLDRVRLHPRNIICPICRGHGYNNS